MRIFGREAKKVVGAVLQPKHYEALVRNFRVQGEPFDTLARYLIGRGDYPWRPSVRTPVGTVRPTLFSRDDVYTLNEVFSRYDYGPGGQRVVVDIGANIGLTALFFLTRRPDSVVYAAEPVPRNLERLRANLADYPTRFHLETRAIAPRGGQAQFFVEETGRLGGLTEFSPRHGREITVECLPIAEYLQAVLDVEGSIDLVKIDTEGSELPLIDAIPEELRRRIKQIVWENNDGTTRWM